MEVDQLRSAGSGCVADSVNVRDFNQDNAHAEKQASGVVDFTRTDKGDRPSRVNPTMKDQYPPPPDQPDHDHPRAHPLHRAGLQACLVVDPSAPRENQMWVEDNRDYPT